MGIGSLSRVQRPGRGVEHPLPSKIEVKERVELYCSPSLGLHGLFYRELYKTHDTLFHTLSHFVLVYWHLTFKPILPLGEKYIV
jgi:hypothetical protein